MQSEDKEIIIGYGVGICFEKLYPSVKKILSLDYICDRKLSVEKYLDIPSIQLRDINADKVTVILFTFRDDIERSMRYDIKKYSKGQWNIINVNELIGIEKRVITGEEINAHFGHVKYSNNEILCADGTVPDGIRIKFVGDNNKIYFGKNLTINNLDIRVGNNGVVNIGDETQIESSEIYVTDGKAVLGNRCLVANEVIIRNNDVHPIFDVYSHERINYSKDVMIGNHVWISRRAMILAGSVIGDGSIVGSGAIIKSTFGKNVTIVGAPGKVIRENVCWSKDSLDYFNRSRLEECNDQATLI